MCRSLLQGYLSDFHNVPLVWEHLIPALIDLFEGTLLLCSKADLGLSDATYRILSCLITRRFPSRFYPIVQVDWTSLHCTEHDMITLHLGHSQTPYSGDLPRISWWQFCSKKEASLLRRPREDCRSAGRGATTRRMYLLHSSESLAATVLNCIFMVTFLIALILIGSWELGYGAWNSIIIMYNINYDLIQLN